MAVGSSDEAVLEYLRALGMPEHCVKFTVIAEVDNVLIAEAVYFVDREVSDRKITKRFHLVEIKE